MAKIESGFPGERFMVLAQPFLDLMKDNPLTGDLYIHSLGYISKGKYHYVHRPNGCSQYVMIYCTSGRGTVTIADKRYKIKDYDFVLLPANVPHSYSADDSDPWSIYWVMFMGEKGEIFEKSVPLPISVPPSTHSRIEQRMELFESCFSLLSGEITLEKMNYAIIIFAHFISSFVYVDLLNNTLSQPEYAPQSISRVTHYMSENVERNITLSELASYAGYSESYFYRKFIAETGFAPIDYFIHLKINSASILLIKTDMSITQISAKLGFNNPDYFSRLFKKIVGITASEFRREGFRL